MAYVNFNPNPKRNLVGDCVIRAISKVMGMDWEDTYLELLLQGFSMYDMPSSNDVWGTYLHQNGFTRHIIPDTCPSCYTVIDFCRDNPNMIGILATGTHVIAVENGNYFDTWDSGQETPIYFWQREE